MLGPASFPSKRELSQQKAFSELIFMLISVLTHVFKLSCNKYSVINEVQNLLNYNTNASFKRYGPEEGAVLGTVSLNHT